MPTYVYKFVETGETIEVQQDFSDDSLTELAHPSDGTVRPVKKVFLPVGITFKGGGFYKTDSGKSGSIAGGSSSSDSSSSSSDSSSSSTASSAD
jgi:predicted nucleic acid-binding Zn ribbon protein